LQRSFHRVASDGFEHFLRDGLVRSPTPEGNTPILAVTQLCAVAVITGLLRIATGVLHVQHPPAPATP